MILSLSRALIEYDINDHGCSNMTALYVACMKGNLALAHTLIKIGANVHCQLNNGSTPLYLAIKTGQLDLVKLLINNGANLHDQLSSMTENNAYIEYAIELNHTKMADYLIASISTSPKEILINKLTFYPDQKSEIIAEYERNTYESYHDIPASTIINPKNESTKDQGLFGKDSKIHINLNSL